MNSLNSFVDQVYVVNLDTDIERWGVVSQELKNCGFEKFIRWSGSIFNGGKDLKDRVLGCADSHYRIYKDIISNNYSNVIVFEDDAEFNPDFEKYLDPLLDFLKNEDWKLFYLGGAKQTSELEFFSGNIYKIIKSVKTTHAYMIRGFYASEILNLGLENLDIPVDTVYGSKVQRNGKCYIHTPNLVCQRACKSIIRDEFRSYKLRDWESDSL